MSSYSQSPEPSPSTSSQPPRKRPRNEEITPEERREARAHRNRIAAQNSRDRKKAHFSYLERRIAELEEENRQLKAGFSVPDSTSTTTSSTSGEQDAKDKENQELRARIATLEEGLEAVVKAFTTHGMPPTLPPTGSVAVAAMSSSSTAPAGSSTTPSATVTSTPSHHPSPISTPPTTLTPATDLSSTPSFHVPSINDLFSTPSSSTLSLPSPSVSTPLPLPISTPIIPPSESDPESQSTRHLARVATIRSGEIPPSRMSLQRVDLNSTLALPSPPSKEAMTALLSPPQPLPMISRSPSMSRRWKLSSARSSTATVSVSSQRRPRVYRLLICSRVVDSRECKLKRQRRRRQRTHPRRR
ncbi:hypothetical protein L218DRAFT_262378 [Marasmius fiardii PR-910]|nr:hypothetical protein L218DRAFT_262378 [Marasmius fiardii PR-910]